jgi:hypothetical protein
MRSRDLLWWRMQEPASADFGAQLFAHTHHLARSPTEDHRHRGLLRHGIFATPASPVQPRPCATLRRAGSFTSGTSRRCSPSSAAGVPRGHGRTSRPDWHRLRATRREPTFRRSTAACVCTIEAAHNPEIAGSNRAPATSKAPRTGPFYGPLLHCRLCHTLSAMRASPGHFTRQGQRAPRDRGSDSGRGCPDVGS